MGIADYAGRTVDVLAYQGADTAGGKTVLTQALAIAGKNSGLVTTGIQKLAQRFLIELLTEKGSLTYLPERGTSFMTDARMGRLRNALDVMTSFSAGLVDAEANLIKEERDTDPKDERFDSAEVLNISFIADKASITIRVTSEAGTSRDIIAPLSVRV